MTAPRFDSATLRALIVEAEPDDDADAVLAALPDCGTPIVTDDPHDPGRQRVLLAVVAEPDAHGVYAWVNRLTDGPHGAQGQLRRWGSTDLWFTELHVPRGTMATYRFYPYAADDPALRDGQLVYSRDVADRAVSDPCCPDGAESPFGSVLCTDDAPDLGGWRSPSQTPPVIAGGELAATTWGGDPHAPAVRWRLTAPLGGGSGPTRLVVLVDADKWFDTCDLPGVLASRVGEQDDPIALLGIDAPAGAPARLAQLGANREFLSVVVDDVLTAARAALGVSRTTTIWAGQSLGGIAALAAASWFPASVDEVLAYSPSMWWKPGLTGRPADRTDGSGWIGDELAGATPRPVRLAVGRNEHLLLDAVSALADRLSAAGWPTTLQRFAGGHDIAWWAHLLLADLTTPIGKEAQQ
ncbi:enterochelin esterase domain-containing protein [Gordonia sp. (in: high G+C Gram-positive bacteria)]|uniref:enterochelin esterase domain-containing protein n=1 Tax=Gordonia sp. (in: high G+C Gram-positive bacteria) TaxID=84139 RepID=UPI0039E4E0F1